jgi:hypothetical protein
LFEKKQNDSKNQDELRFNNSLEKIEEKIQELNSLFNDLKANNESKINSKESSEYKIRELKDRNEELLRLLAEKERQNADLENKIKKITHAYNELKQEDLLYNQALDIEESEKKKLEEEKNQFKDKLQSEMHKSLEAEQEKILLQDEVKYQSTEKHKAIKNYYKVIIFSAIAIAVVSGVYTYFFAELAGQQYRVEDIGMRTTGYTIQNLRGDTIDTWLAWRIVESDVIRVNLLNGAKYEKEKIDAIKNALLSEEVIDIDNSLLHKGLQGTTSKHFLGWAGALKKAAETDTQLTIPTRIEFIESAGGEGDITIELVDAIHPDGFSGWTNSIADESQNQILKSRITIYDSKKLTPQQMEAIVRHELGHAFGLAHATAPEDLMFTSIQTQFPYISECDVDAIKTLYDGSKKSQVICEI